MCILTLLQVANIGILEFRIVRRNLNTKIKPRLKQWELIEPVAGFIPYQAHRTVDCTKGGIITNQYLSNWRDCSNCKCNNL